MWWVRVEWDTKIFLQDTCGEDTTQPMRYLIVCRWMDGGVEEIIKFL